MIVRAFVSGLAAACLLSPTIALAQVAVSCSVSSSALVFGDYDPSQPTASDIQGSISVTCNYLLALGTATVAYQISLSPGSGSYAQRRMSATGNTLLYNLYTDAAGSQIWGDGSAGTATISDSYQLGFGLLGSKTVAYPVYGRIPARQMVPSSVYTDSVVVTVTY